MGEQEYAGKDKSRAKAPKGREAKFAVAGRLPSSGFAVSSTSAFVPRL
jgi:hypothetical protein